MVTHFHCFWACGKENLMSHGMQWSKDTHLMNAGKEREAGGARNKPLLEHCLVIFLQLPSTGKCLLVPRNAIELWISSLSHYRWVWTLMSQSPSPNSISAPTHWGSSLQHVNFGGEFRSELLHWARKQRHYWFLRATFQAPLPQRKTSFPWIRGQFRNIINSAKPAFLHVVLRTSSLSLPLSGSSLLPWLATPGSFFPKARVFQPDLLLK